MTRLNAMDDFSLAMGRDCSGTPCIDEFTWVCGFFYVCHSVTKKEKKMKGSRKVLK